MLINHLIELTLPYSQEFGTGNPLVDLLICSGVLSMIFFVFSVKLLTSTPTSTENFDELTGEYPLSPEVVTEVTSLRIAIDEITLSLTLSTEVARAELGYLKQEFDALHVEAENIQGYVRSQRYAFGKLNSEISEQLNGPSKLMAA